MPFSDPDKRRAYNREVMRRMRATRPQYRINQKIIDAARHANQRAEAAGVLGRLTIDEVRTLFAAQTSCVYCGRSDRLELDHVIALGAGGRNRPDNIVIACRWCNADKHKADHPTRWANDHDRCVDCGTTERRHWCHGRCLRCHGVYDRARRRVRKVAA